LNPTAEDEVPAVPSADERFRSLFNLHNAAIRAYCLRRLPTEDANEAASDVFLVAWRRIGEMPGKDQSLMWLFGVARNVVRNQQRSARRRIRLAVRSASTAVMPDDGPEVQMIRNDEHEEILNAVRTLKEADRELLQLKVWEQLTNQQVGVVLGISHRAVDGRYTRALKKLSRQLESGRRTGYGSPLSIEKGEATS
jgi:RNA polymerase sigma-70 factor (ECF subfamily)